MAISTGSPEYLLMRALHIFAVTLFVGNIITAALWKTRSDKTGEPRVIANTNLILAKADLYFTTPGVILIILTGLGMVMRGPYAIMENGWLLASIALLAVTILIWVFVLLPTQKRMADLSVEGMRAGRMPEGYARAGKRWAMFGGIATLLPVIIVFLMVMKPF